MTTDEHRRAFSFGQVAQQYDQYRPGYPDELFRDLLDGLVAPRILEAGAGTGRATIELATRGALVDAVEPDPEMAKQIQAHSGNLTVKVIVQRFEETQPVDNTYDIVVCAQAWHWIDPASGNAVARRALKPGGTLAVWWNRPRSFEGPTWPEVMKAYQIHAPKLDRTHRIEDANLAEHLPETLPGFGSWRFTSYDWSQVYSADDYVGVIGTHSDHIALPTRQRSELFEAVRTAIDVFGDGELTYQYRTIMYRAPRD